MAKPNNPRIYACSKVEHAPLWRKLRGDGHNIISRWIDLDPITREELQEMWDLTVREDLRRADILFMYLPEAKPLKGGLVELGAMWIQDKPAVVISPFTQAQLREVVGTWPASKRVSVARSLPEAFAQTRAIHFR